MSDFDYIICGNSVGAMTAALTLSKHHKVAVVNPSPNWGGIFAGIKIDGKQFDIGMVFFEFGSFYSKSNELASYNPTIQNDSARFFHLIKDFFMQRMEFAEVGNLKTLWNGVFYEDIIIADQLQVLSSFPINVREKMIAELEKIVAQGQFPLHAAHKKHNENLFLTTSYDDVSLANHGETLHNLLIAPFCRKVVNISEGIIPALFHRLAWCPLYYPETLLSALRGQQVTMPKTVFHYPKNDYFAKGVEVLATELRQNNNITLLQNKPVKLDASGLSTLFFEDGQITAKKIIWGNDLPQLCALLGEETASEKMEKSSMVLVFVEVDKKIVATNFSTLFVCDSATPIYRITNQNAAHIEGDKNKFVFEMNADILIENNINSDDEVIAHIQQFVEETSIFNEKINDEQYAIRRFNNALTMPTAENLQKFNNLQNMVKSRLQNVECIGSAAGFASGSFNDQVVAALHLGEKYGPD
ncbi:MAG: hypothetical protein ACNYPH_06155 [Gammaproteobacteria bacterium WSBS_2016_MAG_OTU1]